jgi:hypothetical protein
MKSGYRLVLTPGAALVFAVVLAACLSAPSSAQKIDIAARSSAIAELSRAGKYSQAIPLAQQLLADLENARSV